MAKVTVMIYTTLRKNLGTAKLELAGGNVREILDRLCDYKNPGVEDLIHDPEGNIGSILC